jgi:uncharacterized protein
VTDTIITVQGSYSTYYPAERATVTLSVHFESDTRDGVFDSATSSAATVRESIADMHDSQSGPITWWSSDMVQVWSEKPWSNTGEQLPLIYHARINFSAKFSDFEALARWVEETAAIDGVTVSHIAWDLTESRKTALTAEVRSRAVKDAVAKASVYAQSIGLGQVKAIALADPGMLGSEASGAGELHRARMSKAALMAAGEGVSELSLKPEEIEVASVVDARFVAS